MTEEEQREKAKADFLKKKKEIDKEYKKLLKEIQKKGYDKMSYGKDSVVPMPGPLFAKFISYMNNHKRVLENIEYSLGIILNTIDASFTANDEFVLELIKKHKDNCDKGLTISDKEMDKEDAEIKIKEKK